MSDVKFLLPCGVDNLKHLAEEPAYLGTKYQQEAKKIRDGVIDALQQDFDKKKRKKLYHQSCDIVQRDKERNFILEWIRQCKKDVIGEGDVHRKSNNIGDHKEIFKDPLEYPVDKYKKEDVIQQYQKMLKIIENQIITKGIDEYSWENLKHINRCLNIFQEDPMIFDFGSILLPENKEKTKKIK